MKKQNIPWHVILTTGAVIISTVCLLIITITLVGGAVFIIQTAAEVQKTYHPQQILGMINDIGSTVSSVHDTTILLSSGERVPIVEDFHNLVVGLGELSKSLGTLDVPDVLHESVVWRNMSMNAFERIKHILDAM